MAQSRSELHFVPILKYFFKKAYGQLVLLDFDITAYTSVAYQRGSLPRSL